MTGNSKSGLGGWRSLYFRVINRVSLELPDMRGVLKPAVPDGTPRRPGKRRMPRPR